MTSTDGTHAATEALSAYLDGRLEGHERSAVEAHLAACARCRDDLEGLRATVAAVRTLPQVRARRSFALTAGQVRPRRRRYALSGLPAPSLRFAQGRLFFGTAGALRLGSAVAVMLLAALLIVDLGNGGTHASRDPAEAPARAEFKEEGAAESGRAPASDARTSDGAMQAADSLEESASRPDGPGENAGSAGDPGTGSAAAPDEPAAGAAAPAEEGNGDPLRSAQVAAGLTAAGLLAASFVVGRRRRTAR